MLDPDDLARVAASFGVADEQVRRDHLVSHVLSAIARVLPDVVFFGGTALSRTHLPHGRLSEDVDLLADDRRAVARVLTDAVPDALRREYPGTLWDPAPDAVRDVEAALLRPPDGLAVRVQVLARVAYAGWPVERRDVEMRYSDVAPVEMLVPRRAAFAGMKTFAWSERRAARDLYDLWALAERGAIDGEALRTFRDAVGWTPGAALFARGPDEWEAALAHQTANLPPVGEALRVVQEAFAALDGP